VVISYTLARVQPSRDLDVFNQISKLPEVKEVIVTYGEYDVIIKVEVANLTDLDEFVFHRLRTIQGVEATTTLIKAAIPPKR